MKNNKPIEKIIMGTFAFFIIKTIFSNESSKIITKKGMKVLSDKSKMSEIENKIKISKQSKDNDPIVI